MRSFRRREAKRQRRSKYEEYSQHSRAWHALADTYAELSHQLVHTDGTGGKARQLVASSAKKSLQKTPPTAPLERQRAQWTTEKG